jgi:Domain of unknown function (DUF6457)
MVLEKWVDDVSRALGIEGDTDIKELLDVSRVVAHKVERRAAPVTTYLMGVAAAQGAADVSKKIISLARTWESDEHNPA